MGCPFWCPVHEPVSVLVVDDGEIMLDLGRGIDEG
jgi:hypothetical protein